jgi:hypothetical protein
MFIMCIMYVILILMMVNIMKSTHNTHFLLSFTVSHVGNADFFVSNQGKNSIENFTKMKGGTE